MNTQHKFELVVSYENGGTSATLHHNNARTELMHVAAPWSHYYVEIVKGKGDWSCISGRWLLTQEQLVQVLVNTRAADFTFADQVLTTMLEVCKIRPYSWTYKPQVTEATAKKAVAPYF